MIITYSHNKLKIFFILICIVINNSFASDQAHKPAPKVVEVQKAIIGDLIQTVRLTGIIKSNNNVNLISEENGILDKIYVSSGSLVNKNDLIATLKNYEYLIEAENISLNQLKSTEILYQKNAASKKDLEEKKRIFLNAKKESQRASFRAPIAGVVGIFKNHIGDNIKSGNELVDIYNRGALYIDFSIPENILPYIKKGQDVYIKSQKNTLSDVQYVLDVETYMAPARVDFSCEDCIIGSYIDLDLVVQTHPKTIIIPFEAVFIKDTKNYVYIVKENKIKETSVTLGLREKEKIEILEGIKENDQIIVRGQSRLSDGQEVKIHNSEVK